MLLDILSKCKLVISDSGGLQEEGSFFNKKVIVCRETTERPEGRVSKHLIMCPSPDKLSGIFNQLKDNYKIDTECPYGDGHSSSKIAKILNEKL
jgi:UDP-N-acetylglucosamine 2-epimerase (non-hydrolysing)